MTSMGSSSSTSGAVIVGEYITDSASCRLWTVARTMGMVARSAARTTLT